MGNSKPIRICLQTHGCKLNQAESESIALQLASFGYAVTDDSPADVMVLNTCTVTHVADRKARQWLRRARRQSPDSLVIVTGCYAERAAPELNRLGADLIYGNHDKERLAQLIAQRLGNDTHNNTDNAPQPRFRTRSFIKIQDGCHRSCAYCIVPRIRHDVYSTPPDQVVAEINRRIAMGYKEVVLTGTEIGTYNHQTVNLAGLIKRVLNETSLERLHLSSLQPRQITAEMLSSWQDPRLARHFHVALQSGCDATLAAMKRGYSANAYRQTLAMIREYVPDAGITTDLIIGFPGENDRHFAESCAFVEACGFSAVHVFPFSPRPETAAAGMPQQVPVSVKRERTLKALSLARSSARKFRENMIGSVQRILWEAETLPGSGIYSGLTSNYLRVFTKSGRPITNMFLHARLIGYASNGLWGELV